MKYRFEIEKKDYTDFASGRVLYNAPNTTAFPVRLASEIIQRAFEIMEEQGAPGPYRIYDPCCGGGFLLTTIGFLFNVRVSELIASDVDKAVLEIAKQNLSLLTMEGLAARRQQLEEYISAYNKDSHREALASAERLANLIDNQPISVRCLQRDITDLTNYSISDVDIIITDIPYGNLVSWAGAGADSLDHLFQNCYKALNKKHSVLVIIADKQPKLRHELFQRVQYFKLGKRQIAFFKPL